MNVIWPGFIAFILGLLALDLGVFNRKNHVPSAREAVAFTAATAVLALVFCGFVYAAFQQHWQGLGLAPDSISGHPNDGQSAATKFLTGYVVELSLSMDNVFVMALIFRHLRVPAAYQHRVLFWGVLGALAMRGGMIAGGAALVSRYQWVMYVFGAFLVATAIRMLVTKEKEAAPDERWIVRWLARHTRVTPEYREHHFLVRIAGAWWLTPLAVALVLVETTDLLFAVDSIPAIFAVTADPYLIFTSNVFAILGLRSLYFGLASLIERFHYLNVSLAVILGLVGAKMLAGKRVANLLGGNETAVMLAVVVTILLIGALASKAKRFNDVS